MIEWNNYQDCFPENEGEYIIAFYRFSVDTATPYVYCTGAARYDSCNGWIDKNNHYVKNVLAWAMFPEFPFDFFAH